MQRDPILHRLKELLPYLKSQNIERVRIFGSRARGEADPYSDLDLLVDFSKTPGLWKRSAIQRELEEKLGVQVDLLTPKSIHWALKDKILQEAADVT